MITSSECFYLPSIEKVDQLSFRLSFSMDATNAADTQAPVISQGTTLVGTQHAHPTSNTRTARDKGKERTQVERDTSSELEYVDDRGTSSFAPVVSSSTQPLSRKRVEEDSRGSAIARAEEHEVSQGLLASPSQEIGNEEEQSQETQDPDFPPIRKGQYNPEQRPRIGPRSLRPTTGIQMSAGNEKLIRAARRAQNRQAPPGPSRLASGSRSVMELEVSDAESEFPTPGTRARDAARERAQKGGAKPFTPLPGTRAAKAIRKGYGG